MAVQISPEIEDRYQEAAERTGESKEDLIRDALLSYLEDLQDISAAKEYLAHPQDTVSLSELKLNLGVDD